MRTSVVRSRGVLVALVAVGAAAALLSTTTGVAEGGSSKRVSAKAVARLKDATGAYHNEQLARASGFAAEDVCVASPQGGMGYHYANETRLGDDVVSADKPEILLYAPVPGKERALLAVEYFKADADQDISTDGDRPTLFGRPFEGPMEGHGPGMPIHYDLHVWVWRPNPSGLFAPFNPRVSCPE